MAFQHPAARRHRFAKVRHRVTNWPAYEAGLRRRGDVTFWLDEAAVGGWQAPPRTTPGGQPRYAELAIAWVLTLRLAFHLALRQAEAFTRSVLRLLGLKLAVPDHTTLSRRGRGFGGHRSSATRHGGPIHLVLDSTGLQLFGPGEWDAEKHGRARRQWRKLHLAAKIHCLADDHGRPVAFALTPGNIADISMALPLLDAVAAPRRLIADKAYDAGSLRQWLKARRIKAVIPSTAIRTKPYPLDGHAYRHCNQIERLFCRPKNWRRLATRYDRPAQNYLSSPALIAAVSEWI